MSFTSLIQPRLLSTSRIFSLRSTLQTCEASYSLDEGSRTSMKNSTMRAAMRVLGRAYSRVTAWEFEAYASV